MSSAESADVADEKGLSGDTYGLYQDFTLQYERFNSTARVALTGFTGKGYGWSVALGTPLWNHFYNEIMDYSAYTKDQLKSIGPRIHVTGENLFGELNGVADKTKSPVEICLDAADKAASSLNNGSTEFLEAYQTATK